MQKNKKADTFHLLTKSINELYKQQLWQEPQPLLKVLL
jgi:hypothetical protein